jgi:quercetin dioxygenase-like cupin family protein
MSLVAMAAAAVCAGSTIAQAGGAPAGPTVIMPSSIKWTPVKGMTGVQTAVLWGDPTQSGSQYALRYSVADGVKFPVHTHPMLEQVTVISGTFMVAVGSKWDATKLTALTPGTYVAIPPNLPHYGQAKGATILEVHGIGPDKFVMVK